MAARLPTRPPPRRRRPSVTVVGAHAPGCAGRRSRRNVADWLAHLVPDAAARRLLAPLVRLATYADADEQQAADMLTEALRAGGVRYLDGGWDALVQRLRRTASAAGASHRRWGAGGVRQP
jgi:phytoene dehydrogenase-like protein